MQIQLEDLNYIIFFLFFIWANLANYENFPKKNISHKKMKHLYEINKYIKYSFQNK